MPHRFDNDECFIISPIGDLKNPDDAVRNHVERVRLELIEPALEIANGRLGTQMKAARADMQLGARDIKHHIIKSILSDKMIFVVLTYDKPNVYYELGIAHSAARPVIILKDDRLRRREFDIYTYETLSYSLGEADLDGHRPDINLPVETLAQMIYDTFRAGDGEHAFENPAFDPLNKQGGRFTIYDKFLDVKYPEWSRLMNRAEQSIDFIGTTLLDLSKVDNDRFRLRDDDPTSEGALVDFIAAKVLFGGIDVTVSIVHEDNPALESMLKGPTEYGDVRFHEQVRQEIEWSTRRWMDVADGIGRYDARALDQFNLKAIEDEPGSALPQERRGTFRFVKLLRGQVKFRMTMTDRDVLATPILYRHGRNSSGPALRARSDTPFYDSLRDELVYLRDLNRDQVKAEVQPGRRRVQS